MRYQYQMGGIFEDVIEQVIKGAGGVYEGVKKRTAEDEQKLKDKKDAADKAAADKAKKPEEGLLDRLTKPVKDAAKQQAKTDITKWAIIFIGVYLLTKGR
jgi:hypothetical protein